MIAPGPSIELSMMRTPASGGCGMNDSRNLTDRQIVVGAARLPSRECRWTSGRSRRRARQAWVDYARAVLEGYGFDDERPVDDRVGAEVVKSFRQYLDQWARVAKRGGEFKWSAEVDLEEVEYLVHAFYRVASLATEAATARGRRLMPPEAEAFYASLVHGLLDALESAGTPAAEFAEELRQFWPRFD